MNKCPKCHLTIDNISPYCPLCHTKIGETPNPSYPSLKTKFSFTLTKKIILLIVCILSFIIGLINYLCTPHIKWSIFVIIQLFVLYYIITKFLKGRNKVLRIIFTSSLLICSLSFFWDYYTGLNYWSINYVLPSIAIIYGIFIFIFRLIKYYSFHTNSNYLYLNVFLCFIPTILLILHKVPHPLLSYIASFFAIINLLTLIIFDWQSFKNDLLKNLHI